MGVEVRQLGPEDVDEYVALRRESLQDSPLAFAASPETDRGASPDFIREDLTNPRSAIFGAFDPDLFGVAGIVASEGKSSHTAHIWGMYVKPSSSRCGCGARSARSGDSVRCGIRGGGTDPTECGRKRECGSWPLPICWIRDMGNGARRSSAWLRIGRRLAYGKESPGPRSLTPLRRTGGQPTVRL